jgi:hypothetical protein
MGRHLDLDDSDARPLLATAVLARTLPSPGMGTESAYDWYIRPAPVLISTPKVDWK